MCVRSAVAEQDEVERCDLGHERGGEPVGLARRQRHGAGARPRASDPGAAAQPHRVGATPGPPTSQPALCLPLLRLSLRRLDSVSRFFCLWKTSRDDDQPTHSISAPQASSSCSRSSSSSGCRCVHRCRRRCAVTPRRSPAARPPWRCSPPARSSSATTRSARTPPLCLTCVTRTLSSPPKPHAAFSLLGTFPHSPSSVLFEARCKKLRRGCAAQRTLLLPL